MIVQPLSLPRDKEPRFALDEEVLLTLDGSPKSRRWLVSTAISIMANCMTTGVRFECRTLDQELVASSDSAQVTAHPTLIAALAQVRPILDFIMTQAKKAMSEEFRRQFILVSDAAFERGRASVVTGGESAPEGKTMIVADGAGA